MAQPDRDVAIRMFGNYDEMTVIITRNGTRWHVSWEVTSPFGNEWPIGFGYDSSHFESIVRSAMRELWPEGFQDKLLSTI